MKKQLVCYCHGYSVSDLEQDVAEHGRSTIIDKIIASSKAGDCDCAIKNPKGR